MSIAYATLLTNVAKCLELDITDSAALTRFNLVANMNAAQRFILGHIPEKFIAEAIKNVNRDLTDDVYDYQYPSDYIRMLAVWINGKRARIRENSESDNPLSMDQSPSTYYPVVTLDRERGYRVRPTPLATVSNGQELQYVYQLPAIASNQASLLDDNLQNLLTFKTVELCALQEMTKVEISKIYQVKVMEELAFFMPEKK